VDAQRVGALDVGRPLDLEQELSVGQHAAFAAQSRGEQTELDRGQMHRLAALANLVAGKVDLDVAEAHDRVGFVRRAAIAARR
jgi:hypothetical protein